MINDNHNVYIPEIKEIYCKKRDYLMAKDIKLKNQINNIEKEILEILNHDPVQHLDISFDDPVSTFYFWANHTVKYEDSMPFVTIVEILKPGVVRNKLINFDSRKFNKIQINDTITIYDLIDKTHPISNYEASYTSQSLKEKIITCSIIATKILHSTFRFIDHD